LGTDEPTEAWMLRKLLLTTGRAVEAGLERIGRRPLAAGEAPVLEPYTGYATPEGWVVRGRVLTHLRRAEWEPEQSRWTNLRQMANLFITDEVAGVPVEAGGVAGTSDPEGYVALLVPPSARGAGREWPEVEGGIAGVAGRVRFPVHVPRADARHLVISDVDDTVIETGAHNLARNLWTTFTGSALTRRVHADAAALLGTLTEGGRNPAFYVSSSPWNLHQFLQDVFRRGGLPRGPFFLRDLGITAEGVGRGHLGHKGAAIDAVLAANPDLPAFLLGDTGQKDAKVYLEAIRRHGGRIRGVALREPAPGTTRDDTETIRAIEATGVPCWHGPSFDGAAAHLGMERDDGRSDRDAGRVLRRA
jgi:phosphatidate phosphatase APP1